MLPHRVHRNQRRQANIGAIRVHHGLEVGTNATRSFGEAVEIPLDLEQRNKLDVPTFETFTLYWTLRQTADYQASRNELNSSSDACAAWAGGYTGLCDNHNRVFPSCRLLSKSGLMWQLKSSQSDES